MTDYIKIKTLVSDRKLIEVFMNYADGYLPGWITFNDLMPVVEKIEAQDFGFKMCRKVVEVYRDSTKEVLIKTKEKSRIESLFKAIMQFIQWYIKKEGL